MDPFSTSHICHRHVEDVHEMCMKKFDCEKYFLTNLPGWNFQYANGIGGRVSSKLYFLQISLNLQTV